MTPERIRGCFYGALAGDCLGFPFEELHGPLNRSKASVISFVANFPSNDLKKKMQYTDDTCMMRSVAQSLIDCNEFNAKDMAKNITDLQIHIMMKPRTYGGSIATVFQSLQKSNYSEPFGPAKLQFNGHGSYGNGGAMRVAAAVLYYAQNFEKAMETAINQCLITHTHPDGILGTVLQAASVYIALHAEHNTLDAESFMRQLRVIMKEQEKKIYPNFRINDNPYNKKLDAFEHLLADNKLTADVAKVLGNGEPAIDSVPAAIFSFIRCLNPIEEINIENPIARTIAYAIALKGDTDTIATMAGAIAGAYFGDSYIPKSWLDSFEGASDYANYAEKFSKKFFS